MKVITFYSYKGGVGRSLAAANFSVYLAKLGLKTVLVDFDLEAPGIDAKFPLLEISQEQKGVLDYILHYQERNEDPGSVENLCVPVQILQEDSKVPLWIIPAGQYLSEIYYRDLNRLDWGLIFSEKRNGVEFFQNFVARVREEIKADFLIVDSRTGITEIAGLCTQQLADEVVMFSSLSSESIKVTKYIKNLILKSQVAQELDKNIDVKVVVSRVPKPHDLDQFKQGCCEKFSVEEEKLFFLFSCPQLEQEEFIAITDPEKDEDLVSNYIKLFYGLNLKLASDDVRKEIERISSSLLFSPSPEESEKKVLSLVALYPHPDVYRAAMHFFQHERKYEEVKSFAWKLFDLVPDDEEVQLVLAKIYLHSSLRPFRLRETDKRDVMCVLEPLWGKQKLSAEDAILYANILENEEQYEKSFKIAMSIYEEENELLTKNRACTIAARTAVRLENYEQATELIDSIPVDQYDSSLALIALELLEFRMLNGTSGKDAESVFDLVKDVITQDFNPRLLRNAAPLAKQLQRSAELEDAVKHSKAFQRYSRQPGFHREARNLGLPGLADTNKRSSAEADYDEIPF